MKIAVTYDNGNVFGHFGHTEYFKIYEVENGGIVSAEVVPTNGSGHGALAEFLSSRGVEVLICGGIGGGAQMALADEGITLRAGVSGNADAAVSAYISGALKHDPNARCNHHHEDGHSCHGEHHHHEDGHSCGGHCH